jgi:hypothetical protein
MIEWREILLDFPCLTCNAAPGEPCTTSTGHEKYECHSTRSDAARRAGWEHPEEGRPEQRMR